MKELQVVEQAEINHEQVNRRQFLITAGLAGGGLLLKCSLHPTEVLASESVEAAKAIPLNAWLKIGTDDSVTIMASQAEMGQGIRTTLPAVLAEELGSDWSRVRLEDSPTDPAYRNPRINWQFTGNSESTPSFFELMCQMGASAREMLIGAAAQKWNVDPATCRTETGKVIHMNARRGARFGDLVKLLLWPNRHSRVKRIGGCWEDRWVALKIPVKWTAAPSSASISLCRDWCTPSCANAPFLVGTWFPSTVPPSRASPTSLMSCGFPTELRW
jgi:Molybdopterin-binding domain of aldehyde dehydrogenase